MFKAKFNNWFLNKKFKYSKSELFFNRIIFLCLIFLIISAITFLILTKEFKTPTNFQQSLEMKLTKSANIFGSIGTISTSLLIISCFLKIFFWINRKRKNQK